MNRGAALMRRLGPLLALAAVVLLFALLRPKEFMNGDNLRLILLQTAVVGTAAIGMTLIIVSAGIDLSIGATIALVTVIVAKILVGGSAGWMAALGGIGAGVAAGALIGALVTKGRLSPFIVTLGTLGAYRGIAKGLANETVVNAPPSGLDALMSSLDARWRWTGFPPGVWIAIGLGVATAAMLRSTRFGRHVFAIGSNERTARMCGVPVDRVKLGVYALGGAFAGVAGILQFSYQGQGDPTTAVGYELQAIAAVVIGGASLNGGQGSVFGSLIGATLMTVIANGGTKMNFPNWVQEIVTGVIIVLAVLLDRLRHRESA